MKLLDVVPVDWCTGKAKLDFGKLKGHGQTSEYPVLVNFRECSFICCRSTAPASCHSCALLGTVAVLSNNACMRVKSNSMPWPSAVMHDHSSGVYGRKMLARCHHPAQL